MEINSDFTVRVVIHSDRLPWLPSSIPGVERRMLDRIGDEVARATTIVRYAAGSKFSPHVHGGGEEFLVLEGVFQDEHGDYPPGSYIRNPPQSSHTPSSELGCIIFVKLWQFDLADRHQVRISPNEMSAQAEPCRPGVLVTKLFQDERESVRIEAWEANLEVKIDVLGGAELLVLEGSLSSGADQLQTNSWLRVPIDSQIVAQVGEQGAKVWLKTGHLANVIK
jgi:anti-sigma factor ChrR (cupin superfamily)